MICESCNTDKAETSFYNGHTVCKSCYWKQNKNKKKKQIEADDDKYYAMGVRALMSGK